MKSVVSIKPGNSGYLKANHDQDEDEEANIKVKRGRTAVLTKKSREWSSQCLRILASLMKLDEAKLLCAPLDPITHNEYYCMVDEPLDLSKIILNLHSGKYSLLIELRQEVEQMFDQYKKYFSQRDIKTFNKIQSLEALFDDKLEKISDFGLSRLEYNENDSISERIQKIEEENERVLNQSLLPLQYFQTKAVIKDASKLKLPQNGKSFVNNQEKQKICIPQKPMVSIVSRSGLSTTPCRPSTKPVIFLQNKNVEPEFSDDQNNSMSRCLEREMEKAGVQVVLNVTNIWFGTSRQKPIAPIIVRENGFYMRFLIEENEGTLVDFQIPAHEMVRCCGYHGNPQKHTLFIFLLPSCVTRMIESKLIFLPPTAPSTFPTSLHATIVALFMPTLREDDLAKLVYLLWSMSKHSLFKSSDFYSEIDQAVALKLMSNTNPSIPPVTKEVPAVIPLPIASRKRLTSNNSNNMLKNKKIPTVAKVTGKSVFSNKERPIFRIKEEPLENVLPSEDSSPISNENKSERMDDQFAVFHCVPDGHGGFTLTKSDNNMSDAEDENNDSDQNDDHSHISELDLSSKKSNNILEHK